MGNYFPNLRHHLKTACFQVRLFSCILSTQPCKQNLSLFERVFPDSVTSLSIRERFGFCTFSHAGRNTVLYSAKLPRYRALAIYQILFLMQAALYLTFCIQPEKLLL